MTAAERRQAELARSFQRGWDDGADDEPLTDREIEEIALLIAPAYEAIRNPRPQPVYLPAAA
jgi:hypothetical protein